MAALFAPAKAAVVYFKNGTEMSGTVVSATTGEVELRTQNRTMKINTDQILKIDYRGDETPSTQPAPVPIPAPPAEPAPPRRYVRRRARVWEPYQYKFEDLQHELSIIFGFNSPTSNADFSSAGGSSGSNGGTGALLGGQYLYYQNPRLAWGANVEYSNRSSQDNFVLIPSADTNIYGDTLLMLGVVKYTLTERGWARPYILGGLGLNHTSEIVDATPLIGFSWPPYTGSDETRRLVDGSSWGVASTVRLGIDFNFFQPSFLGLELGWTGLSNGRYSATPAGQLVGLNSITGALDSINFGARWGWRF